MKRRLALSGALLLAVGLAALWLLTRPPLWVKWERRTITDASRTVTLRHRRVTVAENNAALWQSEDGVLVQDVLWEDIDHDDQPELLLLCWRRGKYGDSRPFWVEEDENSWSQHIFIYDWLDGTAKPIWMASDLGREVVSWSFSPRERLILTDRAGTQTAWDWQTWGLTNIPAATLTFAAVGDNLIHRAIYHYAIRSEDGCFDGIFDGIREELEQYDVTSLNQETPFVEEEGDYGDYPRFGTPIQVGEAVAKAGFSVVSCATNHMLDRGAEGLERTAAFFADSGITCVGIQSAGDGAYRPYELLEQNGIRCALFSYTALTNCPVPEETPWVLHTLWDEEQVRADLAQGRQEADVCIVYVHWGTEYAAEPDETQLHWAQVFADCGVDVVIGTHPHVLQPVQWLTGADGHETLVYYSLGNYISAQTDPACQTGGLAYFTITKQNAQCQITDHGLKQVQTRQENGRYRTEVVDDE